MSSITDQEKDEFVLAVSLLTEDNLIGPTMGEVYYYLNPHVQSTQIKGRNSGGYNRLLKIIYCCIKEKRIKFVKDPIEGKRRYKIPKVGGEGEPNDINNQNDDLITFERLAEIISASIPVTAKWIKEVNLKSYEIDGVLFFSENEVLEYLHSISTGPNKEINKMDNVKKNDPSLEDVFDAIIECLKDNPNGVNFKKIHSQLPNSNYETVRVMVRVLENRGQIKLTRKEGASNIYNLPEVKDIAPKFGVVHNTDIKEARILECEICPKTIVSAPVRPKLYIVSCNICGVAYLVDGDIYYRLPPAKKTSIWGPK